MNRSLLEVFRKSKSCPQLSNYPDQADACFVNPYTLKEPAETPKHTPTRPLRIRNEKLPQWVFLSTERLLSNYNDHSQMAQTTSSAINTTQMEYRLVVHALVEVLKAHALSNSIH